MSADVSRPPSLWSMPGLSCVAQVSASGGGLQPLPQVERKKNNLWPWSEMWGEPGLGEEASAPRRELECFPLCQRKHGARWL